MGKIKQKRVAEAIRIRLSRLFLLEVQDPRVQGVTITSVTLDRELQHADIRVNALGDESREQEILEGLKSAHSFMRRELARSLKLRKLPQLHFHWDHSFQHAMHVESLLNELDIPPEVEPEVDPEGEQDRLSAE